MYHESFEGQAGVSQQDIVSDAVCQRLRRRSGGQMVDLSSEYSVALLHVAPSTHALGLGAARGAVRRRWLKKEKVICTVITSLVPYSLHSPSACPPPRSSICIYHESVVGENTGATPTGGNTLRAEKIPTIAPSLPNARWCSDALPFDHQAALDTDQK